MSEQECPNYKMQHGQICWLEVPIADIKRAQKFYAAVLKWECDPEAMTPSPVGGIKGLYMLTAGSLAGAFLLMEEGHHVANHAADKPLALPLLPTFFVGSVDEVLGKVGEEGGKTVVGKTYIGNGMGYFARFTDTEGNLVGIYSST